MLNFILKQAIYSLHTTDVDGTSNFRTIKYFKSANNNWFNKKQSTWSPFNYKPTKLLIEPAPHPLTYRHRRLFLEDEGQQPSDRQDSNKHVSEEEKESPPFQVCQ